MIYDDIRAAIGEAGGLVTVAGIAKMASVKPTTVRSDYVTKPDFPTPLILGETRERCWIRAEVQAWMTNRWG